SMEFCDTFWEADYTFRVLCVEQLVRTKLNSVSKRRLKDLIHLVELWESGAITDDSVRRVAFDPQWFTGDKVRRFHDNFKAVVEASAKSGLRRYEMRGKAIADHFDSLLQRAIQSSPCDGRRWQAETRARIHVGAEPAVAPDRGGI